MIDERRAGEHYGIRSMITEKIVLGIPGVRK